MNIFQKAMIVPVLYWVIPQRFVSFFLFCKEKGITGRYYWTKVNISFPCRQFSNVAVYQNLSGNLFKTQVTGFYPRTTESESLGWGIDIYVFISLSKWFWIWVRFVNLHSTLSKPLLIYNIRDVSWPDILCNWIILHFHNLICHSKWIFWMHFISRLILLSFIPFPS